MFGLFLKTKPFSRACDATLHHRDKRKYIKSSSSKTGLSIRQPFLNSVFFDPQLMHSKRMTSLMQSCLTKIVAASSGARASSTTTTRRMASQFVVAPIASSVVQMRSVRPIANASVSKSLVGSFGNSFSHANASNRRGAFMSTEAYDDSESPAESEESPAETNGGEVGIHRQPLLGHGRAIVARFIRAIRSHGLRDCNRPKHREISRVWICHGAVARVGGQRDCCVERVGTVWRQ